MTDLLGLTWVEAFSLDADELIRLEQAAMRRMATTKRLTPVQFDVLVEQWNELTPPEREARRAVCVRTRKHDWVLAPMEDVSCCRRCLTYITEGT